MRISILYFSLFRDLAGADESEIILDAEESAEPTLSDLLQEIYRLHPALRQWDNRLLVAVNCEYADRDRLLSDGDEVALMPPVQGG